MTSGQCGAGTSSQRSTSSSKTERGTSVASETNASITLPQKRKSVSRRTTAIAAHSNGLP